MSTHIEEFRESVIACSNSLCCSGEKLDAAISSRDSRTGARRTRPSGSNSPLHDGTPDRWGETSRRRSAGAGLFPGFQWGCLASQRPEVKCPDQRRSFGCRAFVGNRASEPASVRVVGSRGLYRAEPRSAASASGVLATCRRRPHREFGRGERNSSDRGLDLPCNERVGRASPGAGTERRSKTDTRVGERIGRLVSQTRSELACRSARSERSRRRARCETALRRPHCDPGTNARTPQGIRAAGLGKAGPQEISGRIIQPPNCRNRPPNFRQSFSAIVSDCQMEADHA